MQSPGYLTPSAVPGASTTLELRSGRGPGTAPPEQASRSPSPTACSPRASIRETWATPAPPQGASVRDVTEGSGIAYRELFSPPGSGQLVRTPVTRRPGSGT